MLTSVIGAWVTFQVTFTELNGTTKAVEETARSYGWQSVVVGAIFAICDAAVLAAISFVWMIKRFDPYAVHLFTSFLLFAAGGSLLRQARRTFLDQKWQRGAVLFNVAATSLPLNKAGVAFGFWMIFERFACVLPVWLGVSLWHGWKTGTLGVITALGLSLLSTLSGKRIDLFRLDVPNLYWISASVVLAYGLYFLEEIMSGSI